MKIFCQNHKKILNNQFTATFKLLAAFNLRDENNTKLKL